MAVLLMFSACVPTEQPLPVENEPEEAGQATEIAEEVADTPQVEDSPQSQNPELWIDQAFGFSFEIPTGHSITGDYEDLTDDQKAVTLQHWALSRSGATLGEGLFVKVFEWGTSTSLSEWATSRGFGEGTTTTLDGQPALFFADMQGMAHNDTYLVAITGNRFVLSVSAFYHEENSPLKEDLETLVGSLNI